jgi:hypothetical protein
MAGRMIPGPVKDMEYGVIVKAVLSDACGDIIRNNH